MKQKKKDLVPLPVIIYNANNFYRYFIQSLYKCYYSIVKSEPQCVGTLMEFGRFVWIHNHSSVNKLYSSGFFGKGDLSRSEPTWFDRNVQQNKLSLEDLTVERRRKRRNQELTNENMLTPEQVLHSTAQKDAETFQLDLYESFFLVYATNSLVIKNTNGVQLSIQDCWLLFCQYNSQFHVNYAVYHYYRSLGWVPKNGSKFGVNFVLYESGPSFRHADYAIIVIPIYSDEIEEPKSWEWLLCLNRICTQVKKTLVLCYVSIPKNTSLYSNLNEYAIREVIYKRWSPQKNRE